MSSMAPRPHAGESKVEGQRASALPPRHGEKGGRKSTGRVGRSPGWNMSFIMHRYEVGHASVAFLLVLKLSGGKDRRICP